MDDEVQHATLSRQTTAIVITVIVLTWALMVFCVRIYLRLMLKRSFAVDDLACAIGMLCGIGSSTAALVGTKDGLGKHVTSLTAAQIERFFKSNYAASIFYVIALCGSKCSTAVLVSRLKPGGRPLLSQYWLPFVSLIWGVFSTFVVAFQCDLPGPWEGRCPNLFAKWVVVEGFSCAIEAVLFCLAVKIMWDLHMKLGSKIVVLCILASRLLIIIPTGFRLHYLHDPSLASDPTYQGVKLVITTQIVLHYTLMAATFPCMKPFLAAFDKELWHASHLEPTVGISFLRSRQAHDNKGYVLHSIDKEPNTVASTKFSSTGGSTRTDIERAPQVAETPAEADASGPMIIRKTQEWEVRHETPS